jgi:hypothetical protein
MKKFLGCVVLVPFFTFSFAQNRAQYDELVRQASLLYEKQSFQQAAWTYKEAFDQLEGKAVPDHRYQAACSYALAGNADTAFYHLFRLANDSKFDNYEQLSAEHDLDAIYNDLRWNQLLAIVKANQEKAAESMDKVLADLLSDVYYADQDSRHEIKSVAKKYGNDSPEMKAQWKKISEIDSLNQLTVTNILDERGWLGADVVGKKGNQALFLVIQHADITTQEKYLPMMRQAVKDGKARASSLALLEDRVLLRQGKRQIYGSQVFIDGATGAQFVKPLDDPEHVDERRASVGLDSLSKYLSLWDMKWDVEEYKKQLPAIEARMRELSLDGWR